jgi:hypothetical protein
MRFAIQWLGSPVASSRSHGVPRRDVLRGIHVGVDRQTTGAAPEPRLALSRFRVAVPTARASLRRVWGIYPLNPARCLVLQSAHQHSQSGSQDAAVEPRLGADVVARILHGALGGAAHTANLEVFNADYLKSASQIRTRLLNPVLAPVCLSGLQAGDGEPRAAATIRTRLGTGEPSFQTPQPGRLALFQSWHVQQLSRRQCRRHHRPSVYPTDFAVTRCGDRHGDRCEGNVPTSCTVMGDAIGLHPRRYRARPAKPYPSSFRNPYLTDLAGHATHMPLPAVTDDPESFVSARLTPARLTCWVLRVEEGDHRLGEVPQGLLLHRLGSHSKPRILGPRLRELPRLLDVARGARTAWAPMRVLLNGEVPYEPGMTAMIPKSCLLDRRWNKSVAGHVNTLATASDNSREVTRRGLSGLKAESFATRCA